MEDPLFTRMQASFKDHRFSTVYFMKLHFYKIKALLYLHMTQFASTVHASALIELNITLPCTLLEA